MPLGMAKKKKHPSEFNLMFVLNLGSNFEVIVYILLFGIFSEEPLN